MDTQVSRRSLRAASSSESSGSGSFVSFLGSLGRGAVTAVIVADFSVDFGAMILCLLMEREEVPLATGVPF